MRIKYANRAAVISEQDCAISTLLFCRVTRSIGYLL